jgi:hypothetical protein
MTNGKCIARPFFKILKILNTNSLCRRAIEMHCVENLFCVVLVARTHRFQEAKGPEAENQCGTCKTKPRRGAASGETEFSFF